MTRDPLLSDDLHEVLSNFPSDALRDLVSVLKQYKSASPFPASRAYAAHELPADANFTSHANAIADEVLWWGSHDLHRQFSGAPEWRDVLISTAKHLDVANAERTSELPTWKIEDAIFRKAVEEWERMPAEEREAVIRKSDFAADVAKSFRSVAATAGIALGARQVLAFLAQRSASAAVPFIGPALAVLGVGWTAYDLSGPGFRVLRPAILTVAYHRRSLRDKRVASAFQD